MAQIECSSAVNVGSFVSVKLRRDRNNRYNYETWREQMVCLLESQGLAGFVDGKTPPPRNDDVAWRRTDWLVKGWILGALSNEVIQNVANLDSARDVWLMLEYKFSESEGAAPPPPPPRPPPPLPGAVANHGKEWHEYLALYRAAMRGDWDTAQQILEQDPEAIKVRMGFSLETALHVAVANGNSTTFVSNLVSLISDDSSLAITDGLGYNPLHVAALTGNHHAALILLRRYPKLLYFSSRNNKFPVHLAAEFGHRKTLELLLFHTRFYLETNPLNGDGGLLLLVLLIDADFFGE